MKFLAMHITNQILSFDIFTVGNLQNIFMEHDLNILMILGIKVKCIILTHTMYCWLLLQIYLCYLWLLLCSRVTFMKNTLILRTQIQRSPFRSAFIISCLNISVWFIVLLCFILKIWWFSWRTKFTEESFLLEQNRKHCYRKQARRRAVGNWYLFMCIVLWLDYFQLQTSINFILLFIIYYFLCLI